MLYNKHNLAVANFASKSEIRKEIACVFFTDKKTVATDSFRLVEVSTDTALEDERFPEQAGNRKPMKGVKPFLVNAKQVKDLKLPNKGNNDEALALGVFHSDKVRVEVATSEGDSRNLRPVDGEFPDYEQIFPTEEPAVKILVNGEYLAEVASMLAKMNAFGKVEIELSSNPHKPIVLRGRNDKKTQTARAMVMPMLTDR